MEHQRSPSGDGDSAAAQRPPSEGRDSAAAQRPPSEGGDSYKLSYELIGHERDAIKICSCGDGRIASSSRDNTVKIWSPYPGKNAFILSKTLKGHADFVAAIAWFPPSQQLAKGGIVSGGDDKVVILWDLTTGEIEQRMKGHREQVTGVAVAESRDIFSSSLDGTIRQWRKGSLIHCWEAHAKGVEALKQLPTGELLTCSSDFTIKLWGGKTCLKTFQGHTDIVRDLAVLSEFIISASQDCSIKLWAENGEVLKEMIGHTSSVLSVDAHSSGLVASGSEDGFLKIWRDGFCIQSIEVLDCIWDVKFLENGDIATASGDGAVRIWTSDKDRIAEAIELEFFEISLAERKKLGLDKSEDIEAFNSPDQDDEVLAPPTTTTVAPPPGRGPPAM